MRVRISASFDSVGAIIALVLTWKFARAKFKPVAINAKVPRQ